MRPEKWRRRVEVEGDVVEVEKDRPRAASATELISNSQS